jgi:sulfatase modifying factor 1
VARSARLALTALALATALPGCRGDVTAPDAGPNATPPWKTDEAEPEPRPGMMWIPGGVLIAGTPPDKIPRVADEEMAGEQVVMHGFYVDLFPYPNEVGAIPTTNLSLVEADKACKDQQKRLCTELELERSCKGADNTVYEYGDVYKPTVCVTGNKRSLTPNGVNASCQSAFGVHDLHGGVWTWTASTWRRDPAKPNLVAIRGGNGENGDLVGRCANGRGLKPDTRREDLGVRCCAGEPNTFEVVLEVTRGDPLKWQPPDERMAPALQKLLPEDFATLKDKRAFKFERQWRWHPLGNEELLIAGGCARPADHRSCGVVVTRIRLDVPQLLAWVPSDWWQPTLSESDLAREVFMHGGDVNGAFRKKISYAWGKIAVGEKERKRKHKGEREPRYGE